MAGATGSLSSQSQASSDQTIDNTFNKIMQQLNAHALSSGVTHSQANVRMSANGDFDG